MIKPEFDSKISKKRLPSFSREGTFRASIDILLIEPGY